MAPDLARRYRVRALDQRGHCDSAHTASYAIDEFVGDVDAFLGLLRHELVALVRGGKTAVLPRETAERMVSVLPRAEIAEIADLATPSPLTNRRS